MQYPVQQHTSPTLDPNLLHYHGFVSEFLGYHVTKWWWTVSHALLLSEIGPNTVVALLLHSVYCDLRLSNGLCQLYGIFNCFLHTHLSQLIQWKDSAETQIAVMIDRMSELNLPGPLRLFFNEPLRTRIGENWESYNSASAAVFVIFLGENHRFSNDWLPICCP